MTAFANTGHPPLNGVPEELAGEARRTARRVKGAVREAATEGAETITKWVPAVRQRVAAGLKNVADDPGRLLEQVRTLVRENPLATVATVAVASIALVRLLRRKR